MRRYSLFSPRPPYIQLATVLAPSMGAARVKLLANPIAGKVAAGKGVETLKVDRTPAPTHGWVILAAQNWAVRDGELPSGERLQVVPHKDVAGDLWVEGTARYPNGICVGQGERKGVTFIPPRTKQAPLFQGPVEPLGVPAPEVPPPFKVGDRVKRVGAPGAVPVGTLGEVVKVDPRAVYVRWANTLPHSQGCPYYPEGPEISSFRVLEVIPPVAEPAPAPPPPFKVGDRVLRIGKGLWVPLGTEGEVIEVEENFVRVRWPQDGANGCTRYDRPSPHTHRIDDWSALEVLLPKPTKSPLRAYLQKRLDYELGRLNSSQKAIEELTALLEELP